MSELNVGGSNMTVELRENTLYAEANTGNKQWVAVLTDTHPQYNYDREFVAYQKPKTSNRDSGTTSVEDGAVIERVRYTHSQKNRTDRYYQLVDGEAHQIDEADVEAAIGGEIVADVPDDETHECDECGDEFELPPSDAEGRKYCSKACYGVSQDTTEVRTCPCGTTFRTQQTSDKQTCSHPCEGELKTSKPRPDDVNALLWLLYEYEEHTIKETHKRANHHLDDDDRLTRDEVSDRLIEMGVHSNLIQIKAQQAAEREDVSADIPSGDETWRQYQEGRADD